MATNSEKVYLVWSNEHGAWWGHNQCGYNAHVKDAGRYSLEEAIRCCDRRSWGGNWRVPPELPIHVDAANALERVETLPTTPSPDPPEQLEELDPDE